MNELLICNTLSALLADYGIRDVVISSGTRNAPLIAALSSNDALSLTMIVDERSAAFVALGKALVSDRPVALVCTSGSALLNYAPALAEAYYSHVPLIAISADRPSFIIDRNDGQTIRQNNSLSAIVKNSYFISESDSLDTAELTINDALTCSRMKPTGPVHLNVAISDPTVVGDGHMEVSPRRIRTIQHSGLLSKESMSELAGRLSQADRVMIWAGASQPSQRLNKALAKVAGFGNFVIVSEIGSNLHGKSFVSSPDTILIDREFPKICPQILITFGKPLLSSRLKQILSKQNIEHWHVGYTERAADVMSKQTLRIETDPEAFITQLTASMRRPAHRSNYADIVGESYTASCVKARNFIDALPWCELSAIKTILRHCPKEFNLQISNGMSVRYTHLLDYTHFHRCDYNRGVSGIDGSTSTAVGASTVYNETTLLITGDMSARYDIGGLGLRCVTPKFKVVVICNNGGQIFRHIKPTRDFDNLEQYICPNDPAPFADLAKAWGYKVFTASTHDELKSVLPDFINESTQPALLELHTELNVITEIMTKFYKL
ncbi:MAG: 2-succinyl-5-enolpyruvyl-6-hydroxy-3-cyclohexene-1-carboxylic-acid synthase [Bacteroidales bacterium]|nr:2-succinyl-5-enolpyruvyl-6-hydroxy-3-cyclohexene-1-carboxylic-acid synthase [Bacteroidales bacterium]